MEQLIQKYIRYFYVALIGGISIQLLDIILTTLKGETQLETFILMFLSIINIILLGSNLKHSIKQQFTESKINAKILRFTIAILMVLQVTLGFIKGPNLITLANYIMAIVIIEVILNYRIKSIEHLEKLADQFIRENALDQKGE